MESRLVIFLALIISFSVVMSLSGYKKYFNPDSKIKLEIVDFDKLKIEQDKSPKASSTGPSLADLGKEIYLGKGQCVTCHGQNGEGNASEEAPVLAGQHDWYILSSLQKFKEKKDRVNEKMDQYIKDLSKDDFKKLAAYISQLK